MESKISKGPWIAKGGGKRRWAVYGANRSICQLTRQDEQHAESHNAHLLAAAPDMLEALKNIENDDGRIPLAIWEMRNAAIKKAEGAA